MIATWDQAKALGYCSEGLRIWFADKDIAYLDFIKTGAPVEWLLAKDDAMATKLAELAMKEAQWAAEAKSK